MFWGLIMQLYVEWKSLVLKIGFLTGLMRCCGFSKHKRCQLACMPVRFGLPTQFLKHDNGFSNPLQVAHMAFLKRILGIKSTSAKWCVFWECAQEPLLAILLVQVSCQILEQDGWFKQQYFTRCYESRYPLGILVLLIVGLYRWRMLLVICRMALYTEVTYYNAGSWIFLICTLTSGIRQFGERHMFKILALV